MYKIKEKIQGGGRKNKGGNEQESEEYNFMTDEVGSVRWNDNGTDFLAGRNLVKNKEFTLPSTSKSIKRKLNNSPSHQVENKKLKGGEFNGFTFDDLTKINHQISQEIFSTEFTGVGKINVYDFDLSFLDGVDLSNLNDSDINVDDFDPSFLDGVDLSNLNDSDLSWLDDFQGNNASRPAISPQQETSATLPPYRIPLIDYRQKDGDSEAFAKLAFNVVRKRFSTLGVKSGNKRTPSEIRSMERSNRACGIVWDVQKKIYYKRQLDGVNDFTLSMERGAGNCGEMSGIVAQIINTSGGKAAQYCVDDFGTHAFALSGEPSVGAVDHIKMSDYKGCWVVDPWAGIVCEAHNYCDEFKTKMNKWALKGKEVFSHGSWMIANSPLWVNAVINGKKKVNIPRDNFLHETL